MLIQNNTFNWHYSSPTWTAPQVFKTLEHDNKFTAVNHGNATFGHSYIVPTPIQKLKTYLVDPADVKSSLESDDPFDPVLKLAWSIPSAIAHLKGLGVQCYVYLSLWDVDDRLDFDPQKVWSFDLDYGQWLRNAFVELVDSSIGTQHVRAVFLVKGLMQEILKPDVLTLRVRAHFKYEGSLTQNVYVQGVLNFVYQHMQSSGGR